jgi:hypothetical protein
MKESGFCSWQEREVHFHTKRLNRGLDLSNTVLMFVEGAFISAKMDATPLSNAEVTETLSGTEGPVLVLMAPCVKKHRRRFTSRTCVK